MNLVPPPNQPIDPTEVEGRAQSVAQMLLSPEVTQAQRTSTLAQIRRQNQTFHALVRMTLDRMRSQARSVGQDLVLQQGLAA